MVYMEICSCINGKHSNTSYTILAGDRYCWCISYFLHFFSSNFLNTFCIITYQVKKMFKHLLGFRTKFPYATGIRISLVPTKVYRLTVKGGFKNIEMSQDGRISRLQSCLHHDKKNCYKSRKGPPTLFRSMQLIENFHGYTLWLHIFINNSQHGILT